MLHCCPPWEQVNGGGRRWYIEKMSNIYFCIVTNILIAVSHTKLVLCFDNYVVLYPRLFASLAPSVLALKHVINFG